MRAIGCALVVLVVVVALVVAGIVGFVRSGHSNWSISGPVYPGTDHR